MSETALTADAPLGHPRRRPLDAEARAHGDAPLAMQIALRVEKIAPPTDLDACAAAARACVMLLAQAEALAVADEPDTTWLDAVEAWRGVAIRKIVRRCRGKRWDDAQALAGTTARVGSAHARAFLPAPAWPLPPELAKMQVEGTELPRATNESAGTPPASDADGADSADGSHGGERKGGPSPDAVVTVRLSPLVTMTSGKSAAQCAHAAQRAWEAMDGADRTRWVDGAYAVRVHRDSREGWSRNPGRVSIVDAGFTELDGEHETTRADW